MDATTESYNKLNLSDDLGCTEEKEMEEQENVQIEIKSKRKVCMQGDNRDDEDHIKDNEKDVTHNH